MKTCVFLSIFILIFSVFALTMADNAEAARLGGGRSFGSKPSMSVPAQQPRMRQQQTQNPAAAAQAAPRSGMFGGMGGLFGGLLAGTLLGSLLSGHGFSGGGFMDILLLGLIAFIGYKLFTRFRQKSEPAPAASGANYAASGNPNVNDSMSRSTPWDMLRGATAQGTPASAAATADIPAGFDQEEFLRGAKMLYNRMQKSWDGRDIDDIAQFSTPAVINVIKEQLKTDPNPSHTEIMLVNADLLGVEQEGEVKRAQVYFDVLLREDQSQTEPVTVREIWHFICVGANGKWKLDGIQQVQ